MENAPQVAPQPPSGGKKNKLLLPIIIGAAVLIIAVIAIIIAVVASSDSTSSGSKKRKNDTEAADVSLEADTTLPQYAPENTNLILYVNGKKIFANDIYKAFKKTEFYDDSIGNLSSAINYDANEILLGELCAFTNTDSFMNRPYFSFIYRSEKGSAEAVFDIGSRLMRKERYLEFRETRVDDKKAAKIRNGFFILLDRNLLQGSYSEDRFNIINEPMKRNSSSSIAKAIDTNAVVSVVWRGEIPRKLLRDIPSELKPYQNIADDLKQVTLNLYDSGDELELKLVGDYESRGAAKDAADSLRGLYELSKRELGKNQYVPDYIIDLMKRIKISSGDKQVTISVRYSKRKIVKVIQTLDDERRENRRRWERERRRREEEWEREREERDRGMRRAPKDDDDYAPKSGYKKSYKESCSSKSEDKPVKSYSYPKAAEKAYPKEDAKVSYGNTTNAEPSYEAKKTDDGWKVEQKK